MAVDGLIIPRTYNDYFSRSDPAAIRQLVSQYTDDALSTTSELPVQNKVVKGALDGVGSEIDAIEAKIPTQATAENQLADKDFVNSSIGTNTANYISDNGLPFASVAALEAYAGTVTNNDYAFVTGTDADGNTYYDRYKATVSGGSTTWALEYRLNNSSFTAAQWAAISSGITAAKVAQYDQAIGVTFDNYPSSASANPVKASGIFAASQTLTAASTTITGAPIEAGSNVKIMFTADLTGTDTATGLSLTYNGNTYAVKAAKQGALANLTAHEVSTGVYKYLQAYTALELYFDGTQFVIIGNPIVLSSANYTIYADGYYQHGEYLDFANASEWVTVSGYTVYETSQDCVIQAKGAGGQGVRLFDGSSLNVGDSGSSSEDYVLVGTVSASDYSGNGIVYFPFKKGSRFYVHSSKIGGSANTSYYREIPYTN